MRIPLLEQNVVWEKSKFRELGIQLYVGLEKVTKIKKEISTN